MKKILCALLLMLISVSAFSQKVVGVKRCYDSDNVLYVKTKIVNNTWKDIVCVVFKIEYEHTHIYDGDRYKEVVVKTHIDSSAYKIVTYYPPKNYTSPIRQILVRVIFSDGSYKNF